jgi:hypothetical protein
MNDLFALLPDWLKTYQPHLSAIASIITIIGIPIGVAVFMWEKRRERHDREYGTYISLDDKYIDYLKICFEHPDLDVYETAIDDRCIPLLDQKEPGVLRRELIIYTIFVSMCERAYLVYRQHSSKIRKRQWEGWEEYLRDDCRHEGFHKAWCVVGRQFDKDFLKLVNKMMDETSPKAPAGSDAEADRQV